MHAVGGRGRDTRHILLLQSIHYTNDVRPAPFHSARTAEDTRPLPELAIEPAQSLLTLTSSSGMGTKVATTRS